MFISHVQSSSLIESTFLREKTGEKDDRERERRDGAT